MERHQVSTGQVIVLLLLLALVALSLSAASLREVILTRSGSARVATDAVAQAAMSARLLEKFDSTSSTTWMLEALGGTAVVLGLGEAFRRCCR